MSEPSFGDLLQTLATAHEAELQSLKNDHAAAVAALHETYSAKVASMVAEIQLLKEQSKKTDQHDASKGSMCMPERVSPERHDIVLMTEKEGDSEKHVTHFLKRWWLRDKIWGKDLVTLGTIMAVHNLSILPATISTNGGQYYQLDWLGCYGGTIFPHSNFRTCWDLMGLFLIMIDCVTLPYILAFKPDPTTASRTIDWVSLVFWTGDMLQGPFLGYFLDGHYVSDNLLIVKNYLKTWFLVDALVVFPEWLVIMLPKGQDASSPQALAAVGKAVKSVRVVRVLRLLRLAKIKDILETLYDISRSEIAFVLLEVWQLVLFVLLLNHVIACAWFYIADNARKSGRRNWITLVETDDEAALSDSFLYLTSLHWSLTQFTPSGMKVSATSEGETVFSIIVLFFALLVFSSFLASISAHLSRLRSLRSSPTKQLWMLRRFLRERKVSSNLGKRICKFVEHKLSTESRDSHLHFRDVKVNLSKALSEELAFELYSDYICSHPFFARLTEDTPKAMHCMCEKLFQLHLGAKSECIFRQGEEARKMYFVQSGQLEYNSQGDISLVAALSDLDPEIQSVQWISEAVLWVAWRHRGQLIVSQYKECELLFVNPAEFYEIMSMQPKSWLFAAIYGEEFVKYLNNLSKLSDVIFDQTFYKEAVGLSSSITSNPWEADESKLTTTSL